MEKSAHGVRRLLVISHVIHYRCPAGLFAYAPYAREIEIWADLFPEVVIAAPCREGVTPPGDAARFTRSNISIDAKRETGGHTIKSKANQLLQLPLLVAGLCRAMHKADAIHVRCPGNLGLLGVVLAPLFTGKRIAKYAGQWSGFAGEARTVRWQRRLLASGWWQAPVTVYGTWANQPPHVTPFFTSVLTDEQVARARAAANRKRANERRPGDALRVLFVGRLSPAKNVDVLLDSVARLRAEGLRARCVIVGVGSQRAELERRAGELNIADAIEFAGGVEFERVLDHYEAADVLVLASETEGFPKAIAEAMAFGCVCIGTNRGLVPEMLGEGRGLLVEPRDAKGLTSALRSVAASPAEYKAMCERASAWAQRHSLEALREALRNLLAESWKLPPASLTSDARTKTADAFGRAETSVVNHQPEHAKL